MLSRPGPLPTGPLWSFELKWDGFWAIVLTEDGLRVRSRRGWDMTPLLPELAGLPPDLLLDGSASPREIPEYMAAADVVAVPSIRYGGYVDGLPNVALEAMAAGRPVVGSRVGGIPELVREGENGLLVPEKDSAALGAALVTLARDPALRARMGATARTEIRDERSWDAVGARFVEVYERVADS